MFYGHRIIVPMAFGPLPKVPPVRIAEFFAAFFYVESPP